MMKLLGKYWLALDTSLLKPAPALLFSFVKLSARTDAEEEVCLSTVRWLSPWN